jgi:hypothetical protein
MVDCHLSNINYFEKSNIATQEAKEGKVKDGERKRCWFFEEFRSSVLGHARNMHFKNILQVRVYSTMIHVGL